MGAIQPYSLNNARNFIRSNKFLTNLFVGYQSFSYFCGMEEENIRKVLFSDEFEEYYNQLESRIREKYDYALNLIKSQYIVNKKFVKHLENTDFYELRISISNDEFRTVLFAIDNSSFIQSKRVLLLNSFVKKGTKQYKAEIKLAERLLKKFLEE